MLGFKRKAEALDYAQAQYEHYKSLNFDHNQAYANTIEDVHKKFQGVDLALILKIVMLFLSLLETKK
jgi:hypothetical protein